MGAIVRRCEVVGGNFNGVGKCCGVWYLCACGVGMRVISVGEVCSWSCRMVGGA